MLLRIEQYYDAIMALWNQLYINMKSLVSWHYCLIDIEKIKAMTIAKVSIAPASVVSPPSVCKLAALSFLSGQGT